MIGLLTIGTIIFCIGLYGVLAHKEMLRIFISVEIMVAAVNLLLAGFMIYSGGSGEVVSQGLVFLFFVWLFTIANAVVGLPLFLLIRRKTNTQNMDELNKMRG